MLVKILFEGMNDSPTLGLTIRSFILIAVRIISVLLLAVWLELV
jgi:hypothetical protein